jgi:hypothetical protein
MSTYVGMLAAVIARRETPLPLSIGLFGEWGSGKSYFMGLLRDRVKTLANSGNIEYYDDIVQIGFNAWSYADSNLWASLGDEIFRHLAGPAAGDDGDKRPETLHRELEATLERARELGVAKEKAEGEAAQLHSELAEARRAYTESLSALVRATAQEADISKAWSALGVRDQANQIEILVEETRETSAGAETLARAARNPRVRGSVVVGILLLVLLLALPLVGDEFRRLLSGAVITAIVGSVATLTVIVRKTRSALDTVGRTAASIRKRIVENADQKFAEEVAQVRQAEARQQVLQAQLDEVLARAGELGRELVDLNPGNRLYSFLTERAASADYRGQLGLISTIRRDLQQLIKLMEDWRASPGDSARRPIDRIVLYIDDLDRCSPAQVVEVLQAVHLLLALDLFVVVVGVDPRWLLQSLRHRYDRILATGGLTALDEEERIWSSTPSDYLEKIFNIPFVLPSMTPDTFKLLIESLVGDHLRQDQVLPIAATAEAIRPTDKPSESGSAVPGATDAAGPPEAVLHADARSEVAAQTATDALEEIAALPPTPLIRSELEILAALSPMIGRPREAKRLVNLYRMLRSTQDLGDASTFIGWDDQPGHYQAVAVLLGLLTGYPRMLGEILSGRAAPETETRGGLLVRDSLDMTWEAFVLSLRPRQVSDTWCNAVSTDLDEMQCAQWIALVRDAATSTKLVTLPDLEAFRRWGPHVARFSFVLSSFTSQESPSEQRDGNGPD